MTPDGSHRQEDRDTRPAAVAPFTVWKCAEDPKGAQLYGKVLLYLVMSPSNRTKFLGFSDWTTLEGM